MNTDSISQASRLVGRNPRGGAGRVSLAIRNLLRDLPQTSNHGDFTLVAACSGGPDSLAMTVALIDLASRSGLSVATVSVDHGLRPGSDVEAARVAQWCRQLGAVHSAVRRAATGCGGGPEGGAREARWREIYGFAAECSAGSEAPPVPVFLGHTLDDQAESVLLGLGRGSGGRSISGMERFALSGDGRALVCRPLLHVRRSDTAAACTQWGLHPILDPTNAADGPWRAADGSPLRRAALRDRAIPELNRVFGHDIAPALSRTAELLQEDNFALDTAAERLCAEQRETGNLLEQSGAVTLTDFRELSDQPRALRTRVWRLIAERAGLGALTCTHLRQVDRLVTDFTGQRPLDLPGGQVSRVWGTKSLVFTARR